MTGLVLAVDGGNSKTDVALVHPDGSLLAAVHGPSISHQAVGLHQGMTTLAALAADAARLGGATMHPDGLAALAVCCLAGADYPSDVRLLTRAIDTLGLAGRSVVLNDTFAALRAGAHRPWGVALICGQGVNGAGVGPDGRSARFDGLGAISGDWGGGGALGQAALAAAVRAHDGRGPATALRRRVPAHFGLRSASALTRALYVGRIDERRLSELGPLVFEVAGAGDAVAREIADRLADELVAMAGALIRRLAMRHLDPEVVLAGGVFRTEDEAFYDRIRTGIAASAPAARVVRLEAPPVLGSALIGLDRLAAGGAAGRAAEARLREALVAWWRGRDGHG